MKRWLFIVLIVVFSAVFIGSGLYLLDYYTKSQDAKNEYDALAQMVEQARAAQSPLPTQEPTEPSADPYAPGEVPEVTGTTETTEADICVQIPDPQTGEMIRILPEYAQLYTMNTDLVGWIRIDGTKINYPVMQTPDSVDYYLERDFYKKSSAHGAIYVRESCDVNTPSDNVTIYGHRMNDGSMFAALHGYKDKAFFEQHRYIQFDTLTERHIYEIVSVFLLSSTKYSDFQYHRFENAVDEGEFDEFISQCKARQLYDTGVTASFGDKLITLSTCEYSNYNGRLVVVAKRVG